jgi:Uma2 family endonuclease
MKMSGAQHLVFPVEVEVPESKRHLQLRTLLFQFLERAFKNVAAIGCDQFVYWDPNDPRACLAPDAFVRFGEEDDLFQIWKVWERGAPEVAVEIISGSDSTELAWQPKLEGYRALGVAELVRFDPEASRPLRIWDRIEEDLVERVIVAPSSQSRRLRGYWLIAEQAGLGLTLRLSHDERGVHLYPTPAEAAEQRVLELEAELRRHRQS